MGTINVIYDSRHPERYEVLLKEFETQGITDYKFWDCIIMPNVVESINASHKMIVRDAKEKGLDEVIIAEDDLMFTSPNSWKYFLSQKPSSYDLYLWGSYILPISNNMVCGFQLYFVSSKFYDKYLSIKDDAHVDTEMDTLKGDYHFCYPFPALQRKGFSANNKMVSDYNIILKEEDIYK